MISVAEALALALEGVGPLDRHEAVPLRECIGRTLAEDVVATRNQPPFPASAMDGYAVRLSDARNGASLPVAGTSRAGGSFADSLPARSAIRIFTGARVPNGADAILIQENAEPASDGTIRVVHAPEAGRYVRPEGFDFRRGDVLARRGQVVDAGLATLLATASFDHPSLVARPRVAVISTGDELVPLGSEPGRDEIVASSVHGVIAILREAGAEAFDLGIARDTVDDLERSLGLADEAEADLVVTLGGASVGDHDLVRPVLARRGVAMSFEKVAMRPGKPLMLGRQSGRTYIGLPGNPVSSLVCARIFLAPVVARMLGRTHVHDWREGVLGAELPPNDEREEFMRARVELTDAGHLEVHAFSRQDSSLVSRYAAADALLHRPAHAGVGHVGDNCRFIALRALAPFGSVVATRG